MIIDIDLYHNKVKEICNYCFSDKCTHSKNILDISYNVFNKCDLYSCPFVKVIIDINESRTEGDKIK